MAKHLFGLRKQFSKIGFFVGAHGAMEMDFPHVFHGECLYLQLLVLMAVDPCFGHMSRPKEARGVPRMTSYVPVEDDSASLSFTS